MTYGINHPVSIQGSPELAVDEISGSHGGRCCDIEAIRQFWDAALKRLKVQAELAASRAQPSTVNKDSTRQIHGDEKQP